MAECPLSFLRSAILQSSQTRPFGPDPRRGSRWLALTILWFPLILPAADPVPVRVATVTSGPVSEALQLTGTFTAARSASLSSQIAGLIKTLPVDAGDEVAAGALLLELDAQLAALELDRAAAALDEGRARLAEAERLEGEARKLVADNMIPRTAVEAAEAEVALNRAAVTRLEAERARQAELLVRHRVMAPFAGVVSRRLTELGEWVGTGQPVLELVATDRLRLDLQVPQDYFVDIVVGKPVTIRVDALGGAAIAGQVQARVPVADVASRTFLVRVVTAAPDRRLSPGMSAQALFDIPRTGNALSVPRDALLRTAGGETRVWVVEPAPDGTLRASARSVQAGRTSGEQVEIRTGLESGVQVVVRGNELLREGQAVRLLEPDRAARD